MTLLKQVLRFGLVGVVNTGVYYAAYLGFYLFLPYVVAHLLAWLIAMSVSFWLNCVFTYKVPATLRKLVAYPLSNLPNVAMTTVGVVVLVEWLNLSERVAPLIAGVLAIPMTFAVTRFILVGRVLEVAPSPPGSDPAGGVGRRRH